MNIRKFALFSLLLLPGYASQALVYEAKPLGDLTAKIQAAAFEHREDGLVWGFNSIKSCLYVSGEIAVLKNYCVPKKEYPAKGYTIFSKEFGIVDLYQEDLGPVIKRIAYITVFPAVLNAQVPGPVSAATIPGLNKVLESFYYQRTPACWSTNFSYSEAPEAKCNAGDIVNFEAWAGETQALANDPSAWDALIRKVEDSITRRLVAPEASRHLGPVSETGRPAEVFAPSR
jgi:hypothetical protein